MSAWHDVQDGLLFFVLAASVIDDLRRKRISNWLTLPVFLAALAVAFFAEGWGGWTHGLAGAGVGALSAGGVFIALWLATGGVGGGDAKLMTAVGALVGFPASVGTLVFVSIAGGVQGVLALVVSRGPFKRLLVRLKVPGAADPNFGKKVRYALAIAVGTLAFRFWLAQPPPF